MEGSKAHDERAAVDGGGVYVWAQGDRVVELQLQQRQCSTRRSTKADYSRAGGKGSETWGIYRRHRTGQQGRIG